MSINENKRTRTKLKRALKLSKNPKQYQNLNTENKYIKNRI